MFLTAEQQDKMAEENMSLVYYVVNMFSNTKVSPDELASVAFVGYAKALKAFDTDRNVKFSTYAINVMKNEILFFLRKEQVRIRTGVSMNMALATDKNGNELSVEDTIDTDEWENGRSLEEEVIFSEYADILSEIIETLPPKEQYIITYRYGLDNGIVKTQREIAEIIKMSQANVSKIEKNILDKMRKVMKSDYHVHSI